MKETKIPFLWGDWKMWAFIPRDRREGIFTSPKVKELAAIFRFRAFMPITQNLDLLEIVLLTNINLFSSPLSFAFRFLIY